MHERYGESRGRRRQQGTHQVNFSSYSSGSGYAVVGECGADRSTWADGDDDNDHALIVLNRSIGSCRLGQFDMDDGYQDDAKRIYVAFYSTSGN